MGCFRLSFSHRVFLSVLLLQAFAPSQMSWQGQHPTAVSFAYASEGSCPGGMEYLYFTPQTHKEFERIVEQSDEVFVVNFFNSSELRCVQLTTAWEKFAIVFGKKVRLVLYQLGEPMANDMATVLRAEEEGIPNWRVYYQRQASEPTPTLETIESENQKRMEADRGREDQYAMELEAQRQREVLEELERRKKARIEETRKKGGTSANWTDEEIQLMHTLDEEILHPGGPEGEPEGGQQAKLNPHEISTAPHRNTVQPQPKAKKLKEADPLDDPALAEEGAGDLNPSIIPKNLKKVAAKKASESEGSDNEEKAEEKAKAPEKKGLRNPPENLPPHVLRQREAARRKSQGGSTQHHPNDRRRTRGQRGAEAQQQESKVPLDGLSSRYKLLFPPGTGDAFSHIRQRMNSVLDNLVEKPNGYYKKSTV